MISAAIDPDSASAGHAADPVSSSEHIGGADQLSRHDEQNTGSPLMEMVSFVTGTGLVETTQATGVRHVIVLCTDGTNGVAWWQGRMDAAALKRLGVAMPRPLASSRSGHDILGWLQASAVTVHVVVCHPLLPSLRGAMGGDASRATSWPLGYVVDSTGLQVLAQAAAGRCSVAADIQQSSVASLCAWLAPVATANSARKGQPLAAPPIPQLQGRMASSNANVGVVHLTTQVYGLSPLDVLSLRLRRGFRPIVLQSESKDRWSAQLQSTPWSLRRVIVSHFPSWKGAFATSRRFVCEQQSRQECFPGLLLALPWTQHLWLVCVLSEQKGPAASRSGSQTAVAWYLLGPIDWVQALRSHRDVHSARIPASNDSLDITPSPRLSATQAPSSPAIVSQSNGSRPLVEQWKKAEADHRARQRKMLMKYAGQHSANTAPEDSIADLELLAAYEFLLGCCLVDRLVATIARATAPAAGALLASPSTGIATPEPTAASTNCHVEIVQSEMLPLQESVAKGISSMDGDSIRRFCAMVQQEGILSEEHGADVCLDGSHAPTTVSYWVEHLQEQGWHVLQSPQRGGSNLPVGVSGRALLPRRLASLAAQVRMHVRMDQDDAGCSEVLPGSVILTVWQVTTHILRLHCMLHTRPASSRQASAAFDIGTSAAATLSKHAFEALQDTSKQCMPLRVFYLVPSTFSESLPLSVQRAELSTSVHTAPASASFESSKLSAKLLHRGMGADFVHPARRNTWIRAASISVPTKHVANSIVDAWTSALCHMEAPNASGRRLLLVHTSHSREDFKYAVFAMSVDTPPESGVHSPSTFLWLHCGPAEGGSHMAGVALLMEPCEVMLRPRVPLEVVPADVASSGDAPRAVFRQLSDGFAAWAVRHVAVSVRNAWLLAAARASSGGFRGSPQVSMFDNRQHRFGTGGAAAMTWLSEHDRASRAGHALGLDAPASRPGSTTTLLQEAWCRVHSAPLESGVSTAGTESKLSSSPVQVLLHGGSATSFAVETLISQESEQAAAQLPLSCAMPSSQPRLKTFDLLMHTEPYTDGQAIEEKNCSIVRSLMQWLDFRCTRGATATGDMLPSHAHIAAAAARAVQHSHGLHALSDQLRSIVWLHSCSSQEDTVSAVSLEVVLQTAPSAGKADGEAQTETAPQPAQVTVRSVVSSTMCELARGAARKAAPAGAPSSNSKAVGCADGHLAAGIVDTLASARSRSVQRLLMHKNTAHSLPVSHRDLAATLSSAQARKAHSVVQLPLTPISNLLLLELLKSHASAGYGKIPAGSVISPQAILKVFSGIFQRHLLSALAAISCAPLPSYQYKREVSDTDPALWSVAVLLPPTEGDSTPDPAFVRFDIVATAQHEVIGSCPELAAAAWLAPSYAHASRNMAAASMQCTVRAQHREASGGPIAASGTHAASPADGAVRISVKSHAFGEAALQALAAVLGVESIADCGAQLVQLMEQGKRIALSLHMRVYTLQHAHREAQEVGSVLQHRGRLLRRHLLHAWTDAHWACLQAYVYRARQNMHAQLHIPSPLLVHPLCASRICALGSAAATLAPSATSPGTGQVITVPLWVLTPASALVECLRGAATLSPGRAVEAVAQHLAQLVWQQVAAIFELHQLWHLACMAPPLPSERGGSASPPGAPQALCPTYTLPGGPSVGIVQLLPPAIADTLPLLRLSVVADDSRTRSIASFGLPEPAGSVAGGRSVSKSRPGIGFGHASAAVESTASLTMDTVRSDGRSVALGSALQSDTTTTTTAFRVPREPRTVSGDGVDAGGSMHSGHKPIEQRSDAGARLAGKPLARPAGGGGGGGGARRRWLRRKVSKANVAADDALGDGEDSEYSNLPPNIVLVHEDDDRMMATTSSLGEEGVDTMHTAEAASTGQDDQWSVASGEAGHSARDVNDIMLSGMSLDSASSRTPNDPSRLLWPPVGSELNSALAALVGGSSGAFAWHLPASVPVWCRVYVQDSPQAAREAVPHQQTATDSADVPAPARPALHTVLSNLARVAQDASAGVLLDHMKQSHQVSPLLVPIQAGVGGGADSEGGGQAGGTVSSGPTGVVPGGKDPPVVSGGGLPQAAWSPTSSSQGLASIAKLLHPTPSTELVQQAQQYSALCQGGVVEPPPDTVDGAAVLGALPPEASSALQWSVPAWEIGQFLPSLQGIVACPLGCHSRLPQTAEALCMKVSADSMVPFVVYNCGGVFVYKSDVEAATAQQRSWKRAVDGAMLALQETHSLAQDDSSVPRGTPTAHPDAPLATLGNAALPAFCWGAAASSAGGNTPSAKAAAHAAVLAGGAAPSSPPPGPRGAVSGSTDFNTPSSSSVPRSALPSGSSMMSPGEDSPATSFAEGPPTAVGAGVFMLCMTVVQQEELDNVLGGNLGVPRSAFQTDSESSFDGVKQGCSHILLTVHGLTEAPATLLDGLARILRQKLDTLSSSVLATALARNPKFQITQQDLSVMLPWYNPNMSVASLAEHAECVAQKGQAVQPVGSLWPAPTAPLSALRTSCSPPAPPSAAHLLFGRVADHAIRDTAFFPYALDSVGQLLPPLQLSSSCRRDPSWALRQDGGRTSLSVRLVQKQTGLLQASSPSLAPIHTEGLEEQASYRVVRALFAYAHAPAHGGGSQASAGPRGGSFSYRSVRTPGIKQQLYASIGAGAAAVSVTFIQALERRDRVNPLSPAAATADRRATLGSDSTREVESRWPSKLVDESPETSVRFAREIYQQAVLSTHQHKDTQAMVSSLSQVPAPPSGTDAWIGESTLVPRTVVLPLQAGGFRQMGVLVEVWSPTSSDTSSMDAQALSRAVQHQIRRAWAAWTAACVPLPLLRGVPLSQLDQSRAVLALWKQFMQSSPVVLPAALPVALSAAVAWSSQDVSKSAWTVLLDRLQKSPVNATSTPPPVPGSTRNTVRAQPGHGASQQSQGHPVMLSPKEDSLPQMTGRRAITADETRSLPPVDMTGRSRSSGPQGAPDDAQSADTTPIPAGFSSSVFELSAMAVQPTSVAHALAIVLRDTQAVDLRCEVVNATETEVDSPPLSSDAGDNTPPASPASPSLTAASPPRSTAGGGGLSKLASPPQIRRPASRLGLRSRAPLPPHLAAAAAARSRGGGGGPGVPSALGVVRGGAGPSAVAALAGHNTPKENTSAAVKSTPGASWAWVVLRLRAASDGNVTVESDLLHGPYAMLCFRGLADSADELAATAQDALQWHERMGIGALSPGRAAVPTGIVAGRDQTYDCTFSDSGSSAGADVHTGAALVTSCTRHERHRSLPEQQGAPPPQLLPAARTTSDEVATPLRNSTPLSETATPLAAQTGTRLAPSTGKGPPGLSSMSLERSPMHAPVHRSDTLPLEENTQVAEGKRVAAGEAEGTGGMPIRQTTSEEPMTPPLTAARGGHSAAIMTLASPLKPADDARHTPVPAAALHHLPIPFATVMLPQRALVLLAARRVLASVVRAMPRNVAQAAVGPRMAHRVDVQPIPLGDDPLLFVDVEQSLAHDAFSSLLQAQESTVALLQAAVQGTEHPAPGDLADGTPRRQRSAPMPESSPMAILRQASEAGTSRLGSGGGGGDAGGTSQPEMWMGSPGTTLHIVWRVSWQGPPLLSAALLRAAADAGLLLCAPATEQVGVFITNHWGVLQQFITVQLRCAWSTSQRQGSLGSSRSLSLEAGAAGGGAPGAADATSEAGGQVPSAADAPQRRRAAGVDDAPAVSISPSPSHRRAVSAREAPFDAVGAPPAVAGGGAVEDAPAAPSVADSALGLSAVPEFVRSTWTDTVFPPPFKLLWRREAMLLIGVAPPNHNQGSPDDGAATCAVHLVASSGVPGALLSTVLASVRPPRIRSDLEEGEGAARKALGM